MSFYVTRKISSKVKIDFCFKNQENIQYILNGKKTRNRQTILIFSRRFGYSKLLKLFQSNMLQGGEGSKKQIFS